MTPGLISGALLIVAKDLRLERRARTSLPTMWLFALLVVFLFTLAVPAPPSADQAKLYARVATPRMAAASFWVGVMLSAVIGASGLYATEEASGGFDGLRLSPIDPAAIYLGKTIALFLLLLAVLVVVVPVWLVFYDLPLRGVVSFILLAILGVAGIASLGALLSAMAASAPGREFLLPLLLLPMAAPLLMNLMAASPRLLAGEPLAALGPRWAILGAYDVAVLAAALALFEFVVEGD